MLGSSMAKKRVPDVAAEQRKKPWTDARCEGETGLDDSSRRRAPPRTQPHSLRALAGPLPGSARRHSMQGTPGVSELSWQWLAAHSGRRSEIIRPVKDYDRFKGQSAAAQDNIMSRIVSSVRRNGATGRQFFSPVPRGGRAHACTISRSRWSLQCRSRFNLGAGSRRSSRAGRLSRL